MWTKKSYDALYNWIDASRRDEVKAILLSDGLSDIVARLEASSNLGEWYKITHEAVAAVGPKIVEASARDAEADLNQMAAALGRKGGSVSSEAKTKASRENAKKGGWPKGRPRKPPVD